MINPATLAAQTIKEIVPDFTPKIGMILGSGLGAIAEAIEDVKIIDFSDIQGFPPFTVEGHTGTLYLGTLKGVPVACLCGRAHYYEGFSFLNESLPIQQLMAPARALKLLGCEIMISTNSSGSMREDITPGSLVLIKDHINFQFKNPLVGPNDGEFGPRFVSMDDAYDSELREIFIQSAKRLGIDLNEGIYMGVIGPSFETPAEIRMFRQWGADVVGMSTIPEVISARHCGLRVAAIAAISNMAAGLSSVKLSHELTLSGAKQSVDKLLRLIIGFVEQYNINNQ